MQEALLAAAVQWPREGLPDNPLGWLIHVAARRMTDYVRSELSRRRREEVAAPSQTGTFLDEYSAIGGIDGDQDDTLILLFMCCHPALTRPSAIALTLRAVGGLTTTEIANAFLVPEATMAQRISRAKQQIRKSGLPFVMPSNRERAERVGAVLHVLYLIFNEGYTSSSGADLRRADLSDEAIRLTRLVNNLLPDDGEVAGLLALMLLTDARRAARTGPAGELIPLDKQDRELWDRAAISEGVALVSRTLSRGSVGVYQLQAAIAAVPRRGGESRRYRLAADPGALQRAETDVGQPDGHAQSRDRGGDGPRRARGSALASGARRRSRDWRRTIVCLPCAPTCWKWLATCRARFSNMLRLRSGRRASRSGTTSWRRRPAARLSSWCLSGRHRSGRGADDSCAEASRVRALARPQRQSSHTLPLPSAATTHGQRLGASGFFRTRSIWRRALSVAGSPSKCRPSFIRVFSQSSNALSDAHESARHRRGT